MFINNFENIDFDNIILSDKELLICDIIKIISTKFTNVEYNIENIEDGQKKKTCSNKLFMDKYPEYKFDNIIENILDTIDWFIINYENIKK